MTALLLTLLLWVGTATAQDEPSPMSFDDFEFAAESIEPAPAVEARRAKRAEAIDQIEMLAVRVEEGDQRAELMLRLAHLMHQQGRDTRDRELVLRSAEIYARLLASYPSHERADHIVFYLGFALLSTDQPGGVESLTKLIKQYPTSEYVPHAYLHLGEEYFAQGDTRRAVSAYTKATQQRFPFFDFALYKRAWSLRQAGETNAAIAVMEQAVQEARPGLKGTALEALAYWSREAGLAVDPSLTQQVVTTRHGNCLDEQPGHRAVLAEDPMGRRAGEAQVAMVRCLTSLSEPADAEMRTLEARFGKGSAWWKLQERATRKWMKRELKALRRA